MEHRPAAPATLDNLLAHFREQARYCDEYGSPFTARLLEHMASDLAAGGPVADLIADWPGSPRADAVSIRLSGALHAAVLTGRDASLAAQYPEQRRDFDIAAVWPLARALLARDRAWVAEFIRSPPQTNETRRAIALLPAFLSFARTCGGELDVLEIGASAGLNLGWDRFRYQTDGWSWGPEGGVPIDTEWHGPPPADLAIAPRIHTRAGCDQNPLDIRDPRQRLQLRSYIWADQHARLVRFDAAAALAQASAIRVERADAADWLARRLPHCAQDRGTIVYHSLFLQYPPRPTRAAIIAAIEAAGERATERAPFAWLRLEPEGVLGGDRDSPRFWVDLITWPGKQRRLFAYTDGHARKVEVAQSE